MQALHTHALHNTDAIGISIMPKVSVNALIDQVDAVPQAIGYWVDQYRDVHYTHEDTKRIYKLSIIDENTDQEHIISVNTIIQGIQKIVSGNVEINRSIISYILSDIAHGLEGGYIDAEALDAIVQVGLFGEIVYG